MEHQGAALEGRRILLYSYGSGLAASLWSVIARRVGGKFALGAVSAKVRRLCRLPTWGPAQLHPQCAVDELLQPGSFPHVT